ncbi:MAG TPA: M48 family metallopeptidase [Anaerolineae bacterium]|nr:M48 family metallopeptidase [Anaerolineae bacterium]
MFGQRNSGGRGSSILPRLVIGAVIAIISLIGYFGAQVYNPATDEVQHIDMTVEQEIALGLQAAPEIAAQFGGLDPDEQAQALVDRVGQQLVAQTAATDTDYPFQFYLLADPQTINAFALPGGPVFITRGLLDRLETEGQLAGVLAHEVGHVVARHSAEHIAKARLTEGLTGAAVIAAYDPNDPSSQQTAQVAVLIGQLINLKFGRDDELESDRLGVRFMAESGYDPRSMMQVMEILAEASQGQQPPEFFSTHPNPENRIERIQAAIEEAFPTGVPEGLIQ